MAIPLTFVVSMLIAHLLFAHRSLVLESVNGAWIIPPVATIIVPVVLASLLPGTAPATGRLLLPIGYGFWGMGFLLFLLILGLLHDRLVLHPLPGAALAPSLVIPLGPVDVGTVALLKLTAAGGALWRPLAPTVGVVSTVGGTALWGFGFWWLASTLSLLMRYLRNGRLPDRQGS